MSVPYDSAPVARGAKPCSFKRSLTVYETKRFVDRQVGSWRDAATHDRWDKHIAEAEAPREAGLRIIRMIEALKESGYCIREHDDSRAMQTPNTNLAAEVEPVRQDRLPDKKVYCEPPVSTTPRGRKYGVSRTEAEKVREVFRRNPRWASVRLWRTTDPIPLPKIVEPLQEQQVCELCGDERPCQRKGSMTCNFCHKERKGGCEGMISHRLNNKICLRKQQEAHEYHRKHLIQEEDEGWFLARAEIERADGSNLWNSVLWEGEMLWHDRTRDARYR